MYINSLNQNRTNNLVIFLIFILCHIILAYFINELIFTEEVLRNSFEQSSVEIVDKILNFKKKLWWVDFVSPAIFFIIRIFLTALSFYIGFYLFNNFEISFKAIFTGILFGEFIVILTLLLKYYLVKINNLDNIEDINSYMPLSLLSISSIHSNSGPSFHYLLKNINLFELLYIFYFTIYFKKTIGISYGKSFLYVLMTYGLGFLCMCLLITLLILNFSA